MSTLKLQTIEWINIRIVELEIFKSELEFENQEKSIKYKTLMAELNTLNRIIKLENR